MKATKRKHRIEIPMPLPPALNPWTTKLPKISSRMWPANIAMNGRSPRLKGRTMNDTNSIGKRRTFPTQWTPDGTNKEKKCSPCFQKPTPSTIAKLISDITPVKVNWLVTVNGCAWRMTPKGILPIKLANSRKMNAVNTHGRYFLPSGPMLAWTMSSTKPISPSTIICQRPGINSRRMPPNMKNQIVPSTISVHRALLVKTNGLWPPLNEPKIGSISNWCIGSMSPAATLSPLSLSVRAIAGRVFRNPHHVHESPDEAEEQHDQQQPRLRPEPFVEHETDDETARGSTDQVAQDQLAGLIARIGLGLRRPLRFLLLQTIEPLIERSKACVWWKLRDLAVLVLSHASPLCVARG